MAQPASIHDIEHREYGLTLVVIQLSIYIYNLVLQDWIGSQQIIRSTHKQDH